MADTKFKSTLFPEQDVGHSFVLDGWIQYGDKPDEVLDNSYYENCKPVVIEQKAFDEEGEPRYFVRDQYGNAAWVSWTALPWSDVEVTFL